MHLLGVGQLVCMAAEVRAQSQAGVWASSPHAAPRLFPFTQTPFPTLQMRRTMVWLKGAPGLNPGSRLPHCTYRGSALAYAILFLHRIDPPIYILWSISKNRMEAQRWSSWHYLLKYSIVKSLTHSSSQYNEWSNALRLPPELNSQSWCTFNIPCCLYHVPASYIQVVICLVYNQCIWISVTSVPDQTSC